MPIGQMLKGTGAVFGPRDIVAITVAFETALRELKLVDRDDPAVTLVAKFTIEAAIGGERDPERLTAEVIKLISTRMPRA